MNRQGNLILLGPPADTNRTATKPIKADGRSARLDRVWIYCAAEKKQQQLIHLLQLSEHWGVDVTRMKIAATSEGAAATKLPRSSLSAQMCHSGGLTSTERAAAWTGELHLLKINSNLSVAATRHI